MIDKELKNGKIYSLIDPIDGRIRYIGKYEGAYLKKRLSVHICDAKNNKNNNYRLNWIRSLLSKNFLPLICLVKDGYKLRSELCEAEIKYISTYRQIYSDLTNSTIGGDSGNGQHRRKSLCIWN